MIFRINRIVIAPVIVFLCGGCANFQAVKEFSKQGDGLTEAVNVEFAFLSKRCIDNVVLYERVGVRAGELSKSCEQLDVALAELAKSTLDLFGKYNKALEALSDGTKYDMSASFKSTGDRLKALKDSSGSLIQGESVDVALSLANLLADIVTQAIRAREVKQLLNAGGAEWPKVMSPLKTFFGPHAGNTTAGAANSYQIVVLALVSTLDAVTAAIEPATKAENCVIPKGNEKADFYINCEPIRARELSYELIQQRKQFEKRKAKSFVTPSESAEAIHAAIDAWLVAHEKLRQEAFHATPAQLWTNLQALRERVSELNAAIQATKK